MHRRRAIVTVALIALLALAAVACAGKRDFTGYWRGTPYKGYGPIVVHVEKSGDHYTVSGLFREPDFSIAREGDLLVWLSPAIGSGYHRLEFSLEPGGGTLVEREFDSPSSNKPVVAFTLTRATGTAAQLEQEMRTIAARETDPDVRSNIDALAAGIKAWAWDHGRRFPARRALLPGGWFWKWGWKWGYVPSLQNPLTDKAMALSDWPGDFSYTLSAHRTHFSLSGHSVAGPDYTVTGSL